MPKKSKARPGPEEKRLALPGPWMSNVKRALAKKRPKRGWPKPKKTS